MGHIFDLWSLRTMVQAYGLYKRSSNSKKKGRNFVTGGFTDRHDVEYRIVMAAQDFQRLVRFKKKRTIQNAS